MRPCKHSSWLTVYQQDDDITLAHSDRAQVLLHNLPYFESQKPSLFVLIGSASKTRALRELASASTERSIGRRGSGEICLHLDPSTTFSDRPVLVADGDILVHKNPHQAALIHKCHNVTRRILPGRSENIRSRLQVAGDSLCFRLLFPFTDVFCFFAADLGGLQPVARRLATWLNTRQPSTLPAATHPQIVVVTEPSAIENHESQLLDRFLRLLAQETAIEPSTHFAGIRILCLLPDGDVSAQARHRRLKESLMNASDQVRSARVQCRSLFSAQHMASFLTQAYSHFAENPTEPFSFIRASRIGNPAALDLREHLTNFLLKVGTLAELKSFAIPLVASSLLLDNYPPGSHHFRPQDVFRALYKDACYHACRDGVFATNDSRYLVLPSGFVKLIEDAFSDLVEKLESSAAGAATDIHRQLLVAFDSDWQALRSDDTCLTCLRRRPQYGLPCGHCACENCVRVFGKRSEADPWLFEVDSCVFCGAATSGIVVKTFPPTAGVRVLTFDGGGVRGIATLQYLQELQDKLGLPYPVQEHFDLVFCTSVGIIIVLGLITQGWSVEHCIERFEDVAEAAFQPRLSLGRIIGFIISYFADGRYPVDNLEAALQEAFETERTLLDYSRATETGTRIGLVVATIRDTSTCIFTNYNGVGTRPRGCGYFVLGLKDGSGRVPLARCGSAAPSYFKPKHILGLGTFQDGGLEHNDPGSLALEEVAAIYPLVDGPSLVLSLGTGSPRLADVPRMSPTRGVFRDGFIPRLFRAFRHSMGSINGHKFRSRQRGGHKEQYFRFDIEFDGPEPALDDTTKIQELKAAARSAIHGSEELDRLARCVVAELFVFELDHERLPLPENGKYLCAGRILCRLRANHPAFQVLLDQLSKSSAKFLFQGSPLAGSAKDASYFDEGGDFRKRVTFEVPNRGAPISIHLREGSSEPSSISGSPFTIDTLAAALQLECCFGRPDHVKRKRPGTNDRLSRKRQRR
ncbi:uncharacterized protein BP5553_10478 [Venustampulla echinocandica]|uniref:PNPLA domain-containing protein n=1 Tax=Venustampulla echinocandica TaxID=2656787 RepID=A0A370T9F2_9HELO|nr:uncharacterized protein BP5553_10478 [Venustampulla echinocandica]RDL30200.1 hypothetical protein BP5553_10478 [Venustampulla echinocandica]